MARMAWGPGGNRRERQVSLLQKPSSDALAAWCAGGAFMWEKPG